MPACAVDDNDGVCVWRNFFRDFGQMKVHGFDADARHDQCRADIASRTDRPEDIGIRIALIALHARPRAALGPQARQRAFLSNPSFVLEPELDGFSAGAFGQDFRHARGEVFLKASTASGSFFGWIGRTLIR